MIVKDTQQNQDNWLVTNAWFHDTILCSKLQRKTFEKGERVSFSFTFSQNIKENYKLKYFQW